MKPLWIAALCLALPLPGEALIAFSLKQAETRGIAEIAALAGITRLRGFVFDPTAKDFILVGEADPSRAPLHLDNLVTIMRGVLLRGEWPLVSIDPAPGGRQVVRFEGGVAHTPAGRILLEADILLKRLALGLEPLPGGGGPSYFDRIAQRALREPSASQGVSRLWFYPRSPAVEDRGRVFLIRDLDLAVQAQSGGAAGQPSADPAAHEFAAVLSTSLGELFSTYPAVAALREIFEMTAIASGMRASEGRAAVDYWLHRYTVLAVPTAEEVTAQERRQDLGVLAGFPRQLRVRGGVEMQALVLQAADGDATAIEQLVLRARPDVTSVTWRVSLDLPDPAPSAAADERAGGPGTPLDWKIVPAGTSATSPARAPLTQTAPAPAKVGGVKADIQIDASDFANGPVRRKQP